MLQKINGINYAGADVRVATAVGILKATRNLTEGNYVYRQRFQQHRDYVSLLPLNTAGVNGSLLVEETELEPAGIGEIVEWDRVYIGIPPSRTEQGTAVKTYTFCDYLFLNGNLISGQAISYSATIKCDVLYNYFLSSNPQTVPALGQVIMHSIGPFFTAFSVGGFPTAIYNYGGPSYTLPSNNSLYSFISGEIRRYNGDIYERKLIYG